MYRVLSLNLVLFSLLFLLTISIHEACRTRIIGMTFQIHKIEQHFKFKPHTSSMNSINIEHPKVTRSFIKSPSHIAPHCHYNQGTQRVATGNPRSVHEGSSNITRSFVHFHFGLDRANPQDEGSLGDPPTRLLSLLDG